MANNLSDEVVCIRPEDILPKINPMLASIGETGALHQEFGWSEFSETTTKGSAFQKAYCFQESAELQKEIWKVLDSRLRQASDLLVVWSHETEPTEASTNPLERRSEDVPFGTEILSEICAEPIEDGYSHPAEKLLGESFAQYPKKTFSWLYDILHSEGNPSIVASLLKCLGRVKPEGNNASLLNLAKIALKNRDVEVRDAAVQMLELLEMENSCDILLEHLKTEQVNWLREYIESVIEDLKES